MSESLDQCQAKALHLLLRLKGRVLVIQNSLPEPIVESLSQPGGGLVPFPGSDLDPVNRDQYLKLEFEGPEGATQSPYQKWIKKPMDTRPAGQTSGLGGGLGAPFVRCQRTAALVAAKLVEPQS
jgi:hypothetical protein